MSDTTKNYLDQARDFMRRREESSIDDQIAEDFAKARHAAVSTLEPWGNVTEDLRSAFFRNSRGQIQNLLDMGYQIIPPERKVTVELTPDQVKATLRAISLAQPLIKANDAHITPPRTDHLRMLDAYGELMDAITPKEDGCDK